MPLVLELPDMRGQPGAGLVTVPAVALVLGDPVPDLAVREPSVGRCSLLWVVARPLGPWRCAASAADPCWAWWSS